MMPYSEDHIALAAEYALGTLDADERAQVETMMSVDKDFAAIVDAWDDKLSVLNQMVGSVEPRAEVWDKIKTAVGHSEPQAPLVLPQAPPVVVPEVKEPAEVVDTSNVIRLTAQARRWRNVSSFTTAIAAALVAMIAVGVYQPDLLPDGVRPKPRVQVVEVRTPAVAAASSAQYVAVLQKEAGSPAFILTVPRSLGVIGGGDFTARPVLSSYDNDTINTATYAVTVEQAGGSPDGNPHSAPVFTGKLIESVPPR